MLVPVTGGGRWCEHLYGDDWRRPKPGFNWLLDRTDAAVEGVLPGPGPDEGLLGQLLRAHGVHEAARRSSSSSQTCPDTPGTVVDIGCGDGRDGCAFGVAGRTGARARPVAGRHRARHRAAPTSWGSPDVALRECDVSDRDDARPGAGPRSDRGGEPVAVLPAVLPARHRRGRPRRPCWTRSARALAPATCSPPSSAPTRTRAGEGAHEALPALPERRGLPRDLEAGRGWAILHQEEGTGLSPYRGRGPGSRRVIARR